MKSVAAGPTAVARDTVHVHLLSWWHWVMPAAAGLLFLAVMWPGQADLVVSFTNMSDAPVEVYVGGDRVRIIAPYATEYLDVNPYVWAWPRRLEVRRYPRGERLRYWRADLTDLVQNHWRLRVP